MQTYIVDIRIVYRSQINKIAVHDIHICSNVLFVEISFTEFQNLGTGEKNFIQTKHNLIKTETQKQNRIMSMKLEEIIGSPDHWTSPASSKSPYQEGFISSSIA